MNNNVQVSAFLLKRLSPIMSKRGEKVEDIEAAVEDDGFEEKFRKDYEKGCDNDMTLVEYVDLFAAYLPSFTVWTKRTVYFPVRHPVFDRYSEDSPYDEVCYAPRNPEPEAMAPNR